MEAQRGGRERHATFTRIGAVETESRPRWCLGGGLTDGLNQSKSTTRSTKVMKPRGSRRVAVDEQGDCPVNVAVDYQDNVVPQSRDVAMDKQPTQLPMYRRVTAPVPWAYF